MRSLFPWWPTLIVRHLRHGQTSWGVFHNLDCPEEETGAISLHLGHLFIQVLWTRFKSDNPTIGDRGVW